MKHSDIAEYKEAFRLLCQHGSETLYPQDLAALMTSQGLQPTEEDVQKIISIIDQRQTGSVTFEDFLILMGVPVELSDLPELIALLREHDTKGDGIITEVEFSRILHEHGKDLISFEDVNELLSLVKGNPTVDYMELLDSLIARTHT